MSLEAHQLAAEIHALGRARERYGLELSPTQYLTLCLTLQVREGALLLNGHDEHGGEIWAVPHQGRWLIAAFNRALSRIATFLPACRTPLARYGPRPPPLHR